MKTRRPLTPEEIQESQRLKAIYEQRKQAAKIAGRSLNQADVADACGWSGQSAFSQYATGKVPLNLEALLRMAKALDFSPAEVSPRLLKGIAEPMQPSKDMELKPIRAWDEKTPVDEDEVAVPFLKEVELAAGSGRFGIEEDDGSKLRFDKASLRANGVQFEKAKCVRVRGNSMTPVLRDGATVGVNTGLTSITDITDGELYAINHSGQLRVKQAYRMPGGIRLRSFNRDEHPDEDYSFQQMQDQEISIIGHVFWWGMYAK
ncbi:MAG: S24 family peptidase [Pseudomonas farsensis]|uniref:XRE family transcriptional regulator n=1 Tax=Pseudomonas farsensis TaxID=2745492 RepID=UPI003C7CE621